MSPASGPPQRRNGYISASRTIAPSARMPMRMPIRVPMMPAAILSEHEGDLRSQVRMQTEVCWPPAEISHAPEQYRRTIAIDEPSEGSLPPQHHDPPNYRAGAASVRVYASIDGVTSFRIRALRSNISPQKQEFELVHGNHRAKKQFHARNFLETCHSANAVVQEVSELEVYQIVVHNNSVP
ncbi:uncharacterized protein PAC_09787 [Phialocephala subalpina]|uniref:Uncharacterized protein n=1 Tax=Phialocephala subalpina TaxID=576137 RepID=A0A1L7X4F4_9HELO|nr:uncharacterized protein PAC_09787 [Phialocephala subalpina]